MAHSLQSSVESADPKPFKTVEGAAEMRRRQNGLSQRQRTMLFLVDGHRSVAQVKRWAGQAGVHESCFDELLALGLVAVPHPMPLSSAVVSPTPESNGDSSAEESIISSLYPLLQSEFGDFDSGRGEGETDDAFDAARRIVMRAVRAKAPITGALTLIKLQRARTRQDLQALLDEVGSRISSPMRKLSGQQTLHLVRVLLEGSM